MKWLLPLCLMASPALAQTCPPARDHSARQAEIMAELRVSRGAGEARDLSNALWELWLDAPDARAQALLDRAMAQRQQFDLLGARDTLDELVEYCPDYPEGYNQRAFANYLRQDFAAALADLDRVIAMMPGHIAAISGRGLTLMGLGRHDEAQAELRRAVEMNPWLSERALLVDPPGQDI